VAPAARGEIAKSRGNDRFLTVDVVCGNGYPILIPHEQSRA
jgi:hypothetical protein